MFSSENELKILGKATYLFLFSLEVNKEYPLCLKMAMSFIDFFVLVLEKKIILIHPFCPLPYNTIWIII